ncbi:class I SAM-dependent methyltransferase [Ancylobacter novellus]|nr:class I SAM-dependent methyltransferase [Ancylobacter novellus]
MDDIMPISSKRFGEFDDTTFSISLGFDDDPALPNLSVNAAAFMQPIHLEHSAWHEHIPFAFWLTGAHRPRTFVELGTHYGVSYFAFCQAVERLRLSTRCYAVDSWQGDEHAGLYGGDVYEKVSTHNARFYSRFSALMRTTFDEGVAFFADGEIDLLHIDGYHTLEAVKHDFEAWLPKLSERGLVILHDSNERKGDFGVFQFIEELRKTYPCFEFAHGHGLAIVGVGPDQPSLVKRLFEADGDEAKRRNVQEIFARLGKACSNEYAAGHLRSEVAALSRERDRAVGEIERLGTLVARTEAEARRLTGMVGERDNLNETIAAARDQLAELTEENAAFRRDARGAAETLKAVTQNNKVLHGQLEQREREAAETLNMNNVLRAQVGQHERELAAAAQQLALREQELRRLRRSTPWRMTALLRAVTGASRSVSRKQERAPRFMTASARPKLDHADEAFGFERDWYLSAYADVAASGMDAEEHYLRHGKGEGRFPSRAAAEFDRGGYLSANPDVAASGMDPFLHYCAHGKAEGRHFARIGGQGSPQLAAEARQPSFLERRRYEASTPRGDKVRIPDSLHPVVSVIIPTYGQVEFTLRCLSSISAHPPQVPFEIIVMDDAFPGEEVARLKTEVEGIRLIRNPENQGFLYTCNIAAKEASGKYLYFLNNDTEVFPGAIDALVDVLEADQTVGLTGSKLIFPDGKLQEAGGDHLE